MSDSHLRERARDVIEAPAASDPAERLGRLRTLVAENAYTVPPESVADAILARLAGGGPRPGFRGAARAA